ncbi:MAG: MarR family transcriptional regulator [Betaproteobacteria bacterium]|nr:MarR family transcriptional regulator [Betaproteobacteria bacterium]
MPPAKASTKPPAATRSAAPSAAPTASPAPPPAASPPAVHDEAWRLTHLGRLLGLAMRRFDERVLALMAQNLELPLALANLTRRMQVTAGQVHLTRHLSLQGNRLSELATRAGLSKQAMGAIVDQGEAWGLVQRTPDLRDARASVVRFTPMGLLWLQAFRQAVAQAEQELRDDLGPDVATVLTLGLEAYAAGYSPRQAKLPRIS